jgi:hypothetical protein
MKLVKNIQKKKTGSFYILGYLLELIIKFWRIGKQIFKIWPIFQKFRPILFPWKILGMVQNNICQVKIWQIFAPKIN